MCIIFQLDCYLRLYIDDKLVRQRGLAFDLMEGINVHAIEENAEQIMINKARKIVRNKIAVFFTLCSLVPADFV